MLRIENLTKNYGDKKDNMIKAIVYNSQTGHTKQYAEIFGEKTNMPVYELNTAKKELSRGTEIFYFGWLMAGTVQGLKKAAKRFTVKAVCGVGKSYGDSQLADMRKSNHIPDSMPAFYLQGGFELDKLHGIYKLIMKTLKSIVGKGLADKENRTPEEEAMLDLLLHGGNLVSANNLTQVLDWYGEQ